ncbi:MAG: bacterioferritin-associated ferredoxin [Candidatus Azotimanducaceae bacterium]|jgi:bacterioferritin-associated ferredoxin
MQIDLMLRIVLIYNSDMIICVCTNVNSRQLRECLQRGMSIEDISEEVGLGTGCGRCLEYATHIVEKERPLIAREGAA